MKCDFESVHFSNPTEGRPRDARESADNQLHKGILSLYTVRWGDFVLGIGGRRTEEQNLDDNLISIGTEAL
jgi:hypothetical protein